MKIYARFQDDSDNRIAVTHLNSTAPVSYRVVSIELTEEQKQILTPRKTGNSNGFDMYEKIELLSIQDD